MGGHGPQESPGGPVARTQGFHSQGLGSLSGWGTQDPASCTVWQKGKDRVWVPSGVGGQGLGRDPRLVFAHPQGQVCDTWLGK